MQRIKVILAVVFLGGAGIWAYTQNAQAVAAAAEKYGLSDAAQEFASSCRSAMSSSDQEFKSGVATTEGCACIAGEVAKTNGEELVTASAVMEGIIKMSDDAEPDWAAMASDAGIDEMKLGELLQVTYTAVGTCVSAGS